jgi:hypothetical protein
MTPEDKANELVHEFVINMPIPFHIEDAKICALIAVDEILNLMIKEFKWDVKHNGNIDYWQEVKQEINNL